MKGKIIKGIAGFYYVAVAGSGIYECRARGIFRKQKRKPLVGDDVVVELISENEKTGNVVETLPRMNEMLRPAVANVGQALILFAMQHPDPNFMLLDRFLISAQLQHVPCRICFNKADTAEQGTMDRIAAAYAHCGCSVDFISVRTGEGLERVREYVRGTTTVLAGPSGVGKSSLTNALLGSEHMETGEISKKLARGKNTTRHAELIRISENTYICDTPGFSSLETSGLTKEELQDYYAEFSPYIGTCRFQGCAHMSEPDCAVRRAVEDGSISRDRYDSYRTIYEELADAERRRYK